MLLGARRLDILVPTKFPWSMKGEDAELDTLTSDIGIAKILHRKIRYHIPRSGVSRQVNVACSGVANREIGGERQAVLRRPRLRDEFPTYQLNDQVR